MMKKISVIFLTAMLGMAALAGCGNKKQSSDLSEIQESRSTAETLETGNEEPMVEKKTIICTFFPEYDWVCEILGENIDEYDVQLLLDSGVDIHSYQPTAEDIAEISNCDLFVYTGGVSESWIEETLDHAVNENMQVVALMEVLGERVKAEEIVEGMEHAHEEEAHADEEEGHAHDEKTGISHDVTAYDEHVWLSLKNAQILVDKLKDALVVMDSEHQDIFEKNAQEYVAELNELDEKYQEMVDEASNQTVLFGDRFPFRYLTEDYGLEYYAAFTGCSAETEASFETITFLAGKLDELNLPAVLVIENSDQKLAQTIIGSTKERKQEILVMNSLQSVNAEDMKTGVTYLSIMEENLSVLKSALG